MKKIVSTRGTIIRKGLNKTQIYMPYKPKKCPFLSHKFAEHIVRSLGGNHHFRLTQMFIQPHQFKYAHQGIESPL